MSCFFFFVNLRNRSGSGSMIHDINKDRKNKDIEMKCSISFKSIKLETPRNTGG